jgi:hypothetical protein
MIQKVWPLGSRGGTGRLRARLLTVTPTYSHFPLSLRASQEEEEKLRILFGFSPLASQAFVNIVNI